MLAIIPARGGSRGFSGKNMRPLGGKPLIWYTVDAARRSRHVGKIVLSTDDRKIAEAGQAAGADVPFMRPSELATDESPAIDTFLYTIRRLEEEGGGSIEAFVVLQPTSPLRTAEDIDTAIDLFVDKNADSVVSVTHAAHPPQWLRRLKPDGTVGPYLPDTSDLIRQTYEPAYTPNGAVFVLRKSLLEKGSYYSDKTYAYVMPPERSVDIDTELDFKIAECLMRAT